EVKKLPVMYPKSEHLQRAVDLQISSLLATGERDSIDYYLRSYRRQFPELDLNYTFEPDQPVVQRPLTEAMLTPLSEGMKKPSLESVPGPVKPDVRTSQTVEEPPSRTKPKPGPVTQVSKPYVVQVGAYGSVENALRQKMRLEQLGYDVELSSITSRGKKLHAVQVVRYSTRAKAEKVGKKLKSDYGYGFLVLHRPE
ncbi:MAG: SPOR domain-containing protein, partial [Fidelibacterota bacterium]